MNNPLNENAYVEAEVIDEECKAPVLQNIKYPVSEDNLKALVEKYKDVKEIDLEADEETIGKEYQIVKAGQIELAKERNKIEKTRKAIKNPAFTFGKNVDAFAKKLQAIIKDTEAKLKLQRDRVEQNEARKQIEAEEIEEARVSGIKLLMKQYETLPLSCISVSSKEIETTIDSVLLTPTVERFEEFYDEAIANHTNCYNQLLEMKENKILVENAQKIQDEKDAEAKKLQDEENAKLQAEKDLLAEQQADFAKQKANFERQQREQQEVLDRQEAVRVADELMAKQEAERQERQEQDKLILKDAKAKTRSMIIDFDDKDGFNYNDFIEAVINNEIPNIKWICDEF